MTKIQVQNAVQYHSVSVRISWTLNTDLPLDSTYCYSWKIFIRMFSIILLCSRLPSTLSKCVKFIWIENNKIRNTHTHWTEFFIFCIKQMLNFCHNVLCQRLSKHIRVKNTYGIEKKTSWTVVKKIDSDTKTNYKKQ